MKRITVIGSGLIGRAWSIVFARAKHRVHLFDNKKSAAEKGINQIEQGLNDLKKYGLIDENPADVLKRIVVCDTMEQAVSQADYVQENTSESLDVKQKVFRAMDLCAPNHCVLASSTSTIQTSLFSEHLKGRHRCLVAHPVNPPHIVPIVEISPAPWTDPTVIKKTFDLHKLVGQVPILVKKEIAGFVDPGDIQWSIGRMMDCTNFYYKNIVEKQEKGEVRNIDPQVIKMFNKARAKFPQAKTDLEAFIKYMQDDHNKDNRAMDQIARRQTDMEKKVKDVELKVSKLSKVKDKKLFQSKSTDLLHKIANEQGVGIVTKQNATKDVPVGAEYMNIKKMFPGQKMPVPLSGNAKKKDK